MPLGISCFQGAARYISLFQQFFSSFSIIPVEDFICTKLEHGLLSSSGKCSNAVKQCKQNKCCDTCDRLYRKGQRNNVWFFQKKHVAWFVWTVLYLIRSLQHEIWAAEGPSKIEWHLSLSQLQEKEHPRLPRFGASKAPRLKGGFLPAKAEAVLIKNIYHHAC